MLLPKTFGTSIRINMENNNCEKCGQTMKVVSAGVSKRTGKPYGAFLSCTRECGTTAQYNDPQEVRYVAPEPETSGLPQAKPAGQVILDSLKRIEANQEKILKAVTEVYEPLTESEEAVKKGIV